MPKKKPKLPRVTRKHLPSEARDALRAAVLEWAQEPGNTQTRLKELTGISQPTLHYFMTDKTTGIEMGTASALAKAIGKVLILQDL